MLLLGHFNFILDYPEHLTKSAYVRPLKSNLPWLSNGWILPTADFPLLRLKVTHWIYITVHTPLTVHLLWCYFFNYKSDIVPVLITSNKQLPKREWRSGLSKLNEKAEILSQCDFVESEEDQQSGLKYLGS